MTNAAREGLAKRGLVLAWYALKFELGCCHFCSGVKVGLEARWWYSKWGQGRIKTNSEVKMGVECNC
jgi:hypothetical protein